MRQKEKKIKELEEEIEVLGQDSEDKAVKWVQEVGKRDEQQANQEYSDSLNKLDLKKRSLTYSQILVEEANLFLKGFDIPKGYTWGALKTREGIVFWYRNPQGKYFAAGNTISLIPEYDMNGVVRKTYKMLDIIEKEADSREKEAEKSDEKLVLK